MEPYDLNPFFDILTSLLLLAGWIVTVRLARFGRAVRAQDSGLARSEMAMFGVGVFAVSSDAAAAPQPVSSDPLQCPHPSEICLALHACVRRIMRRAPRPPSPRLDFWEGLTPHP
jgi:hypothetical protein